VIRLLVLLVLSLVPALASAHTVAVLYFENQGNPELESLKVGLTQMLITDLQQTDGVTVVERTRLQEILDELELGHSGAVAPETASEVGRLLGAEWLVLGSYFELMGTLRLDARLVDVETGRILHAHGVDDGVRAFMRLEDALADDLKQALLRQAGAPTDSPMRDTRAAPKATPTTPTPVERSPRPEASQLVQPDAQALQAAIAFSDGLIALDRKDVGRARESFQQALEANPDLELARAELAQLDL